ncbi:hypothetical protein [Aliikangiella coralliicola]|uniref:Porin family protein n=1 Tax=Aliikangiella coralliicola TaxID=2592383 RepID=A0A545UJC0_9GAMM|nr:hypothetical protein [Aliikangiella coralliicola]TQV89560.1 hypothetical protein FLL46_01360 [Aliikangiella coralliicola]
MKRVIPIFFVVMVSFCASSNSNASNTLGTFLGQTRHSGENRTTYGLEYERLVASNFSVGVAIEQSREGGHDINSLIGNVFYSPATHWRLGIGYGKEDVSGKDAEDIIRFSLAYEIHVTNSISLAPSIAKDRIDGESQTLAGISLSYHF